MASPAPTEKLRLEKLFQMEGGYVLSFSNRGLQQFVFDVTGLDIYDDRYAYLGSSKANRVRAFWSEESNFQVARLLTALIEVSKEQDADGPLVARCEAAVERLRTEAPVEDLDAIEPNADGQGFETLAQTVKAAIENEQPEVGLDRLHTFVIRYLRVLCERHGIDVPRDKPLHSLMGEYIKSLRARGLIESEMCDRILKSSISILEAFNFVRNDRTLAHDNPLLSYGESLLIYSYVASTVRFISALEEGESADEKADLIVDEDLPF